MSSNLWRLAGRVRVRDWMLVVYGSLVALLVTLGWLASAAIDSSRIEIVRAQQSLVQLENIRAIEAAFSAYLLDEVRRRVDGTTATNESEAAAQLRGALLIYRRTIAEEIALSVTEEERDEERRELVRVNALSGLFESIEMTSRLDRTMAARTGERPDIAGLLLTITGERDAALRRIVREVLEDERGEAAEAFARLDALRARAVMAAVGLSAAFLVLVSALGLLCYRGLVVPIRTLTALFGAMPAAPAGQRAPAAGLPGEFAILGRGFNAMAERIETEQQRLADEVSARTAELASANASLREIDSTRRNFLENVSHELRTPVTVLLGEAQIALRMPGAEREALERIEANGGVLRRRIDDLMRLARSEDGRLTLSPEPVALNAVLSEAVTAARGYAAANEVTLEPFDANDPEVTVLADREALRQAALALIDNAIKYSGPGGVVRVARTGALGFEVLDTGPGFGDADPMALFARYARARPADGPGGSGLGLAIISWIAGEHGARIEAENRTDGTGGARVALHFPEPDARDAGMVEDT